MAELTDGTAELRVLVTTALGALPLENAIVSVSTVPDESGMRTLLHSVTTDSGGMTPVMMLDTPPRSNSLNPDSGPPFAVYTVEISAEGYTPLTALHIAMFSGVPDHAARGAHAAQGKPELRADRPDRHRRAADPRSGSAGESVKGGTVLPEPYVSIPETITVHLGAPSSNAQNVTVPFADYIKNVASSEIYPTWPEQAIRANVYAQMSYVLNRVFTEWYRAQGYDFDITNSTRYDQSFVPGRDIFENISTIVDDMIGTYLTRGDSIEPLFTQYCNGTTVTCPGGLSQWGTVPLAEQGLSAEQILQSFYGSDINFVTGAPLSPNLGGSFPGVTLRLGDFSEDVRTVQTRLNRISTNFPNIPKIYPTDGVFSADTERAVRAFQRQFNLTEDGLVGQATWYRIAFIYNNVKRLSELNSEGLALSEISRQYPERLTEGMSGPGVQLLQYFLAIVGEFYDALPRWQAGQLDGVFGPQTREAVTAYQQLGRAAHDRRSGQRNVVCSALDLPVRAARPARAGVA